VLVSRDGRIELVEAGTSADLRRYSGHLSGERESRDAPRRPQPTRRIE
jgi:hypothetical protein